ncbi:MAG: RidA family protein [Rhodomicrobiaceae bacterium]
MSEDSAARLAALGLALPDAPAPAANYVPFHISNGLLFISGQLSRTAAESVIGKLGADVTVEDGQKAAQLACLNILAQAKAATGSLERISQALRLTGYVNATPDFTEHPKVINGASDLLVAVLGDRGRHTRAAVGMGSLPFDVAVEVDAIFAIS